MGLAFVTGLFANNPALHAALWLIMIGGPPSHGATVRKFTMRAIGAAAALGLAVLATILVSPSATNVFPYMVATFVGVLVMAYIGEGGGLLSYLSIGGTAFVIAFSGLGPRDDRVRVDLDDLGNQLWNADSGGGFDVLAGAGQPHVSRGVSSAAGIDP